MLKLSGMDTPNPLQFFIDLADEKPIEQSDDEPKVEINYSINSDKDLPDENPIKLFDEFGDFMAGFDLDVEPIKSDSKPHCGFDDINEGYTNYWDSSYFSFNLPSKLSKEKTNAIQAVDTVLSGMADIGTAFAKLTELVTTIDTAIGKLNTYDDVKQYPAILSTYNEIKGELYNRKKRLIQPAVAGK